jgi:Fe-coproporphyrin III synthase
MTLTGPDVRILQIHPSRFCNLRCQHCYSSSSPDERSRLPIPLLRQAVAAAARLGYNVLSLSGGEPLLYPGFEQVCGEGRDNGMLVTLVTNGMFLSENRVAMLASCVHAVAISVDGIPERHDHMRRYRGAFRVIEAGLPLLRKAHIPFALVFTLTRDNLTDLEWVADFAVAQGAALLQVHPVEQEGRASNDDPLGALSDPQLSDGRLVVECLKRIHGDRLEMQFDALDRRRLPVPPSEIMSWHDAFQRGERTLGEIVSPLVIEEDGAVVPLRYGFPRRLALGRLEEAPLEQLVGKWREAHSSSFCRLYQNVLESFERSGDLFSNIYQSIAARAESTSTLVSIGA